MTLLAEIADRISRFHAEHIEPLIFGFRLRRRLRFFGLDDRAQAPTATLDFAYAPDCPGPLCEKLGHRYEKYYQRFVHSHRAHPRTIEGSGTLAIIDLKRFSGHQGFLRQLRKQSGNFYRDANKARRQGYTTQPFEYRNHTPDICEIRKSLKTRAFGPVIDAFILTIDALGGAPTILAPIERPQCPRHWELFFGVFLDQPGYRQGEITLNKRMVAYARLHRIGNTVRYAEFIGHGDHMRHGVMMLLHIQLLEWLLDNDNPLAHGVEFITYGAIEQGNNGLFFWKRKALFTPHVLSR